MASAEKKLRDSGVTDEYGNSITLTDEVVKGAMDQVGTRSGIRTFVLSNIQSGTDPEASLDSAFDKLTGASLPDGLTAGQAKKMGAPFYGNESGAAQFLIESMESKGVVSQRGIVGRTLTGLIPGGRGFGQFSFSTLPQILQPSTSGSGQGSSL